MARRKVFNQQVIDSATGELLSENSIYVSNEEIFGMYRKTDGLNWLLRLNGNEIKLLVLLANITDEKDGSVSLSKIKRDKICKMLHVGARSLTMLIGGLVDKDCLVRMNYNDFIINPATFFRCRVKDLGSMITRYNDAKNQ